VLDLYHDFKIRDILMRKFGQHSKNKEADTLDDDFVHTLDKRLLDFNTIMYVYLGMNSNSAEYYQAQFEKHFEN
jgi:hypothetical protein